MHDFTHVSRLVEMDQAIKDGHFPVRWSRNLGYGYGLPQFNFYAPLVYYVAEVFLILGTTPLWAIKLVIMLNFVLAFIVMFYLADRFWGAWAGLLAATAFVYIPYRAVDFYVRGALGELSAITMIALILLMMVWWVDQQNRRYVAYSALAIAGLVLSHNLVAFMALPWLVLVFLVFIGVIKRSWVSIGYGILTVILGLLISSFYALPAFMEKQFTKVDILTQGFSNYQQHFLYLRQFLQTEWGYGGSVFGLEDDVSFQIGTLHIVLAILGGLSVLFARKRKDKFGNVVLIVSGVMIVISILMATFKTQFIWDTIPLFAYVQFPWRYLSLIVVFASIMVGASVRLLPDVRWHRGVFTIVAAIGLIALNLSYFRPEKYLDNTDDLYYTDASRIQTHMSEIIPDFITSYVTEVQTNPPNERYKTNPQADEFRVDIDRTHEFSVLTKNDEPYEFIANIAFFPGWTIYVNGERVKPLINEVSGIMQIPIDRVSEEVRISGKLEETPVRVLGNTLTLLAILGCGYLLMTGDKKLRRVNGS